MTKGDKQFIRTDMLFDVIVVSVVVIWFGLLAVYSVYLTQTQHPNLIMWSAWGVFVVAGIGLAIVVVQEEIKAVRRRREYFGDR